MLSAKSSTTPGTPSTADTPRDASLTGISTLVISEKTCRNRSNETPRPMDETVFHTGRSAPPIASAREKMIKKKHITEIKIGIFMISFKKVYGHKYARLLRGMQMEREMITLPTEVKETLSRLRENGFEAYIIGGCVRDSLIGLPAKDYDITTSALPEETKRVFSDRHVIETGIKHGTVTIVVNKMPIEITTYRVDSEYSDNRRPDSVTFTKSLREDTARRDFTMNAVAVDENGDTVDHHGGIPDIERGLIRCVGDPDKRFGEDALRILRAVRFSSVLGFEIEEETEKAVFRNKALLKNISSERIASELVKLLCGKNARAVITRYVDVLGEFMPEMLPMKGFDQHNVHHIYDILEHTACAVENTPSEPIIRLAALFHDIGKPPCYEMINGVGHFYGHAKVSAEIAHDILVRLKFDNHTKETVIRLVKLHDVQIEETEKAVKRFLNKNTPEVFCALLDLKRADTLAQAPMCLPRLEYIERIRAIAEEILNRKECFSLKQLEVNGKDLIVLGYKPGKAIGVCLGAMLEAVIDGRLKNEKSELVKFAADNMPSFTEG